MESPVPFDADAPLGDERAIIRRNPDDLQEVEMVSATWGSDPRLDGGDSIRFVRAEGRAFPQRRCLIPASEFHMTVGAKRYRVTLDGGNFFYLAGIWTPAMGDWPLSYRIVTVAANAEIIQYQQRQGALIQRREVMHWLDALVPENALLRTPAARTFLIERIVPAAREPALAI